MLFSQVELHQLAVGGAVDPVAITIVIIQLPVSLLTPSDLHTIA